MKLATLRKEPELRTCPIFPFSVTLKKRTKTKSVNSYIPVFQSGSMLSIFTSFHLWKTLENGI